MPETCGKKENGTGRDQKTLLVHPLNPLTAKIEQHLPVGMRVGGHPVKGLQMAVHPQTQNLPRTTLHPHLPQYHRLQRNVGRAANPSAYHRTIIKSFLY
jgi:hypothetical protein